MVQSLDRRFVGTGSRPTNDTADRRARPHHAPNQRDSFNLGHRPTPPAGRTEASAIFGPALAFFGLGRLPPRFRGEPAHDIDQLAVGRAGGIPEFVERMGIGEMAEPDQLADALPPVER